MEQTTSEQAAPTHEVAEQSEPARGVPWDKAVRVGLNAGLVLAGLNVVNWLASLDGDGEFTRGQTGVTFNQPILGLAFFAICALFMGRLVLFYVAGRRAAKRTGQVASGALAGMMAGVVDGVSGLVVTLLGVVLFPMYTLTSGYAGAAAPVGDAILGGVAKTVLLLLVGALVGLVGGGSTESERYPRVA